MLTPYCTHPPFSVEFPCSLSEEQHSRYAAMIRFEAEQRRPLVIDLGGTINVLECSWCCRLTDDLNDLMETGKFSTTGSSPART